MAFLGLPFDWFTLVFALPLDPWIDLRPLLMLVVVFPRLQRLWRTIRK
jgi:hypothetical protein